MLEGLELMGGVDGVAQAQLAALWEARLGAKENSSRSELARGSYLAAEDGGASCLVSEPSHMVLDRGPSSISEVRTSLGNAVSSSNARRTLTRGGMYMLGRPTITLAEREGRDTEQAPAGTGMRLGRRYLSARCLHARQLSANSVLAVLLCRTLSNGGVRGRVLVSMVLVRSPLSTEPLLSSPQPSLAVAVPHNIRSDEVREPSELDGEPGGAEPGSMGEAVSVAQGVLARTGGADAVMAIATSFDMGDEIAELAAQVLQQTSTPVETGHDPDDPADEEEENMVELMGNPGREEQVAGTIATWQIAHEDVQVYGAIPSIPTAPALMAPLPQPGPKAVLIDAGKHSNGLDSFLGGVAQTVLARRVSTRSIDRSQDADDDSKANSRDSTLSDTGPATWLGDSKSQYWLAGSVWEAAEVAVKRDFSTGRRCSLAAVAPAFASDERLPSMEFVSGSVGSSGVDCAHVYTSKFWGDEDEDGRAEQQELSAAYTVEAVREIIPDELAVVLLWISMDTGPERRSFLTESAVLVKEEEPEGGEQDMLTGGQGWRRCHATLQTVRHHVLSHERL